MGISHSPSSSSPGRHRGRPGRLRPLDAHPLRRRSLPGLAAAGHGVLSTPTIRAAILLQEAALWVRLCPRARGAAAAELRRDGGDGRAGGAEAAADEVGGMAAGESWRRRKGIGEERRAWLGARVSPRARVLPPCGRGAGVGKRRATHTRWSRPLICGPLDPSVMDY